MIKAKEQSTDSPEDASWPPTPPLLYIRDLESGCLSQSGDVLQQLSGADTDSVGWFVVILVPNARKVELNFGSNAEPCFVRAI